MKYTRNIFFSLLLCILAVGCIPEPKPAQVVLAGKWQFSNQTIGCEEDKKTVITAESLGKKQELIFFTNGTWQYFENDVFQCKGDFSYKGMATTVEQPTEMTVRRIVDIDYVGTVTYDSYHVGIVWNGTDEIGLLDLATEIDNCDGPSYWKRTGTAPTPATETPATDNNSEQ